jgi:hypothetical protein
MASSQFFPRSIRFVLFVLLGILAMPNGPAAEILLIAPDGTTGSFESIQKALDAAEPGSTVQVPQGVYHERLQFRRSGTKEQPITLQGKPGERAVIDGASPWLQAARNTLWTPFEYKNHTLFATELPFAGDNPGLAIGTWISYKDVPGTNGCDKLIAAYASLDGLVGASRGEGSFRKGNTIFVSLANGRNPNDVPLSAGSSASIVSTGLNSHLRISNIELRNAGWCAISLGETPRFEAEPRGEAETSGAETNADAEYSDIEIEDVVIRNSFRGLNAGPSKGSRISISRVVVANGIDPTWIWRGGYQPGIGQATGNNSDSFAPWRGFGMRLVNLRDSEISKCAVFGQWDGIGVKRSENVKISHCTLADLMDDGVELESSDQRDIWFFNNHIYQAFAGISVTSNFPGPLYIFRNVVEVSRPGGRAQTQSSYAIKSGEDSLGRAENIKFYHNTFWTSDSYNVWEKTRDQAPDRWQGYDFVNNIFYSPRKNCNFRGAGPEDSGKDNHWQGNAYNIDRPQEADSVTIEALADLFVDANTSDKSLPRDLRLKGDGEALGGACDYPARQGWPDSITQGVTSRARGAWDPSMSLSEIGAPDEILRRVQSPSEQ